ncbi:hypothetical protein FE634_01020 [Nocardioides dongxiaopingii]|uniref:hypothetical protein n=1 Tax=Nocardioides TaxID=1839 RepID=UPI0010C76811|nr:MULTISPECIES: hypothetical protein [Nocardioides]QCW49354.2 hypothetical protein FE634_01020 [Nocardioides sp. S-1144]
MRLPPVPDPRELLALLPRAAALVGDAERLLADAAGLVARVEQTRQAAHDVVVRVEATAARADRLVLLVQDPLVRLVPLLEQLADRADPELARSLRTVVEQAPALLESWQDDAVPLLDQLATVSPDLRDLLAASRELNEMLGHLPGMGRARKRVEEARDDADQGDPAATDGPDDPGALKD